MTRPRESGDLIFWHSYLGPNQIGHVMIVWSSVKKTTIEAHNTYGGVGHFSYASGQSHHIFENLAGREPHGPFLETAHLASGQPD